MGIRWITASTIFLGERLESSSSSEKLSLSWVLRLLGVDRSDGLGAMSTRPESVKLPVQRERRLIMEGCFATTGMEFAMAGLFLLLLRREPPEEDIFLTKPIFAWLFLGSKWRALEC